MSATLSPTVDPERPPKVRTKESASKSIFDPAIVTTASVDAVKKLNPRSMAKNPVMFIVEIGSVLTTLLFVRDFGSNSHQENVFTGLVAAFLWFTVLFATFAEAMAFANRVAALAERHDHHPDILVQYSRVTLTLSTHDAGGLTELDFRLAREIGA